MEEHNSVIQKYRLLIAILIFAILTILYSIWSDCKNIYEWFVNLYPELTGAIIIYLLLSFENRFFLKGLKGSYEKNIKEPESKIVLSFWEKIIDKPTDVYIGRNKEDQALSWTDLDAVDLFRKILQNQQKLNLKHLNKIDENINYSKTNIISIGGPKRNNISKEIMSKFKGKILYEFASNDNENFQINKGAIVISNSVDKDYALFYYSKQQNINWTVFSGLTKYSTIACLETMLEESFIKDIALKLNENYSFVEVLFSFDILGEQRINPKILDTNYK